MTGISCTTPGDRTAAGTNEEILGYYQAPAYEGFVINERNGIWVAWSPSLACSR